jgi:DNA-directed RNA polymerase subunit RPC12/RpoP
MREDFMCPYCKKDNYYEGDVLGDEETTMTICSECDHQVILKGHTAYWITADRL